MRLPERAALRSEKPLRILDGLTAGVLENVAGINMSAAAEFAEEKKKNREKNPKPRDLLSVYEQRTKALGALKLELASAFGGSGLNALIMVDELDRCRPNYAVEYLETIKHVFDIHGLA